MDTRVTRPLLVLAIVLLAGTPALAQRPASGGQRRELTAVRIESGLRLDGALDEEVWQRTVPATDFVQSEPYEGQPSTEQTEVRILYDDDSLYVGVICHDGTKGGVRVNALKEDFEPADADYFQVILDTYHDQRNGFVFTTNPHGAKRDAQVTDEGRNVNADWDGVWDVRAVVTDGGWSAELVIPFKTLSLDASRPEQVWGANFSRKIRRKNEIAFWSPVPRRYDINRVVMAGELKGLHAVQRGRNLRVKPFVIGEVRNLASGTDLSPDAGLDLKYNVTPSLTLDVTANTDFSQVEVDEQVVNLTRFAVVFPEKREFFLENSGIFQFGDVPGERGPDRQKEMQLFFSRRIGLFPDGHPRQGEELGILGGGRLSGRVGAYTLGLITMQTKSVENDSQTAVNDSLPSNNFTVVRVKRDVLANSDVGAVLVNRQASGGTDYNRSYGADANFLFLQNLTINGWVAQTKTDGLSCDGGSCTAKKLGFNWRDNRYRFQAVYNDIGRNFNPEVGLKGMPAGRESGRSVRATAEFHLRPPRNPVIREVHPHPRWTIITEPDGTGISYREIHYGLAEIFFHNGARAEVSYNSRLERIEKPFVLPSSPGVIAPAADYRYGYWQYEGESDQSRALFATWDIQAGSFFTGKSRTVNVSATVRPGYRWSVQTSLVNSHVTVPGAEYTNRVVRTRFTYSVSTRMFVNALVQYNSAKKQVTSNLRFDFIHRPLSDLYIVLNEARDTSGLLHDDRIFTVKYTHMLSF